MKGLVVAFLCLPFAQAQQYIISTYAGGVLPPMPASAVSLSIGSPGSVAADDAGNVYFGSLNCCIFKVDTRGIITRIAGTLRDGVAGEGIPAVNAWIEPGTPAVDLAGNVYFAEETLNRVRKISPDGILTTVAGNGQRGYSGDGGPATSAQLSLPSSVAVDRDGNLFIANNYYYDCNGNPPSCVTRGSRISKVFTDGTITTVAGNGTYGSSGDGGPATSAALSWPSSITVDSDGNLFIADVYNNRVRKVSPDGIITTVIANGPGDSTPAGGLANELLCTASSAGDGGPASKAHFCAAAAVAVDAGGNLFILEGGFNDNRNFPDDRIWVNSLVRKVAPDGTVSTVAGNGAVGCSPDGGVATSTPLHAWKLAANHAGDAFFTDCYRIRKVSPGGILTTVAGDGAEYDLGDGGPAKDTMLLNPLGAAVDGAGNLFFLNYDNDGGLANAGVSANARLRRVSQDGIITTVAGGGNAYPGDGGPAASAGLYKPTDVAADGAGNVFVADYHRILRVSPDGTISSIAGQGYPEQTESSGVPAVTALVSPHAIAADQVGNLFIADGTRIRKISPDGIISTVAGMFASPGFSGDGGPPTAAQLSNPRALAVDRAGNLFIADGSLIRKVSTDGIITTVAGNGTSGFSGDGGPATRAQLGKPNAIAVDWDGNLLIADGTRIRRVSVDGTITTVAGTGTVGSGAGPVGYNGDGGPASRATFAAEALALDRVGNVYVTDSFNSAVRILRPIR